MTNTNLRFTVTVGKLEVAKTLMLMDAIRLARDWQALHDGHAIQRLPVTITDDETGKPVEEDDNGAPWRK